MNVIPPLAVGRVKPYELPDIQEYKNESQLVNYAVRLLLGMGCFIWRNNTGRMNGINFGLKGSADIIGMTRNGTFLACELKMPGKKQTPEQVEFQRKVEANTGLYILAHSLSDILAHQEAICL